MFSSGGLQLRSGSTMPGVCLLSGNGEVVRTSQWYQEVRGGAGEASWAEAADGQGRTETVVDDVGLPGLLGTRAEGSISTVGKLERERTSTL
jgi:hypothetical protein